MHDSYHATSHISARDCQITGEPELLAYKRALFIREIYFLEDQSSLYHLLLDFILFM